MSTQTTDTQFIAQLLENSKFAEVTPRFMLEALMQYSEIVSDLAPGDTGTTFVDGETWLGVAQEVGEALRTRFGLVPAAAPTADQPSGTVSLLSALYAADEILIDHFEVERIRTITTDHHPMKVSLETVDSDCFEFVERQVDLKLQDECSLVVITDLDGREHHLTLRHVVFKPVTVQQVLGYEADMRANGSPLPGPAATSA